jgi:hypothetical protein
LNDTFKKNPIAVISKEEQIDINNSNRAKLNSRTQKISDYLGSSGIKNSVLSQNHKEPMVQVDKITNVHLYQIKNSRSEDLRKVVKANKHAYVDKRMFLME